MCLSCGCRLPDDRHGDDRYVVMQDVVDAAEADGVTVEQTWQNITLTIVLVMSWVLSLFFTSPAAAATFALDFSNALRNTYVN